MKRVTTLRRLKIIFRILVMYKSLNSGIYLFQIICFKSKNLVNKYLVLDVIMVDIIVLPNFGVFTEKMILLRLYFPL